VKLTDFLDVLGVLCLALAAYASPWPPACLIVVGAASLLMSWRRS